MSDVISREALRRSIEAMKARYGNENSSLIEQGEVLDLLAESPTVDAVEVVRCEKCRHWHRCMQGDVEILAFSKCLKGNPLGNGNNYFCADGERKEAIE